MKDDTISRAAALTAICEDGTQLERQGQYSMTMAERKQRDTDILSALPPAQPSVSKEEMVGDAVSRQGVLRLLNAVPSEEFATKAMLIGGVNALPSAQLAQDLTKGCTDTISRQAVLNLIEQSCCDLEYDCDNVALRKEVEALPPAQPGWIPCTPETMPKMTDTYLVQVGINENGEGMHTEVRTADWNVVWHEWYVHTTRCLVGDIIKWMPIPWEGEQDEQN